MKTTIKYFMNQVNESDKYLIIVENNSIAQ